MNFFIQLIPFLLRQVFIPSIFFLRMYIIFIVSLIHGGELKKAPAYPLFSLHPETQEVLSKGCLYGDGSHCRNWAFYPLPLLLCLLQVIQTQRYGCVHSLLFLAYGMQCSCRMYVFCELLFAPLLYGNSYRGCPRYTLSGPYEGFYACLPDVRHDRWYT